MIVRSPETFKEKQQIETRVLHEAMVIDLQKRQVLVREVNNVKENWEPFDYLMIATGAVPICPNVPGIDADGIYGVNTLQSGINIRRDVDLKKPKRAVIVGGGYIGLEMAEAFVLRGLEVSLVEHADQVMNTLDGDMAQMVSAALAQIGISLYMQESLEGFDVREGKLQAVVTDKRSLPTDIAILGMGVRPNSKLAKEAGLRLGTKDSIAVNDRMQTDIEGIWAAGDCVESFHLISRRHFHIALGTVANKQGRVAGINIGGKYATFPGVVGTAVSKICSLEVARTGLQEKEIRQLGLEYVSGKINSRTRAGYYPDAGRITVKLLAEKGNGRLLGGQIVGKEGAAKRIDVIATALHAGFNLEEMLNLDLSYAPPYSPVWDPVLIAVRKTRKQMENSICK
ncbi:MAG: FAD-dependent oxidoreductase [Desulfobacterales bacterium]|nr:FAD-dependent oxidoreductase [Desulfobacterales bacterium]